MNQLISSVEFFPIRQRGSLIGFSSFLYDQHLAINSVGVHVRPDGTLRLVFPEAFLPNGKRLNTVCPIDAGTYLEILQAVSQRYKEVTKGFENATTQSQANQ